MEEFVKKLKLPNPDAQAKVRGLYKKVLGHIQKGVAAEVRTPVIEPPREATEDDDANTKKQLREQQKAYDTKKQIDERNREIFILQQNNFYNIQLQLPDGEEDVDDDAK